LCFFFELRLKLSSDAYIRIFFPDSFAFPSPFFPLPQNYSSLLSPLIGQVLHLARSKSVLIQYERERLPIPSRFPHSPRSRPQNVFLTPLGVSFLHFCFVIPDTFLRTISFTVSGPPCKFPFLHSPSGITFVTLGRLLIQFQASLLLIEVRRLFVCVGLPIKVDGFY